MSDVQVTPLEEGAFGVEVVEGNTRTGHRVTVPPAYLDGLGVGDADPEAVIRESFAFLLEREPPSSILREFSLESIEQYFPEYREELPRRLAG
ncbi:MAG: hypothetical protein M3135_09055 [Actinomycetota bacterium]|nr:hypothetical protein [Actinomycetota bacterium]